MWNIARIKYGMGHGDCTIAGGYLVYCRSCIVYQGSVPWNSRSFVIPKRITSALSFNTLLIMKMSSFGSFPIPFPTLILISAFGAKIPWPISYLTTPPSWTWGFVTRTSSSSSSTPGPMPTSWSLDLSKTEACQRNWSTHGFGFVCYVLTSDVA